MYPRCAFAGVISRPLLTDVGEVDFCQLLRRIVSNRASRDPDAFIEGQAKRYMRNVGAAKRAYEADQGPKVMVRYEDLRADTLGTMRRVYSTLGIPTGEEELAQVVKKHAWENISEEKKGRGKFHRKAKPG